MACLGTLLCVTLSSFAVDVTTTYVQRTRAQTAADAAALAAVAESTPYGSGDPRAAAERFAALNDAVLVRCLCEPAATAVQVTVAVDTVLAHARAVFEPGSVLPASLSASTEGLHPLLAASVDKLLAHAGGAVGLVSGYRSSSEQAQLWREALARFGDPEVADDWVAQPGTSMHERGLAVDLGGDTELAAYLVDELDLPLWRPLANEPWHFELRSAESGSLP
jgi:hypothetical protein